MMQSLSTVEADYEFNMMHIDSPPLKNRILRDMGNLLSRKRVVLGSVPLAD